MILGQALGRYLSLSLFTANRALEPDRIIGDKRKREIAGDGERASRDLYLNFTGREGGRQPGKFLWPITVERRQILIGYSPVGSGNRRDIGSHPPLPLYPRFLFTIYFHSPLDSPRVV